MNVRILNVMLVGVFLTALVLSGCSNDKSTATETVGSDVGMGSILSDPENLMIETPYGTVTVNNLAYEKDDPSLTVHYSYVSDLGGGGNRSLHISGENGSITTCSYEVKNESEDILFAVALEVSESDSNSYTISEWTALDSLSLTRTLVGDRMTEVYRMNGVTFVASFTEDELLSIGHSEPQFDSDPIGTGPLPDSPLEDNLLSRFRDFYPQGTSLDDNIDGLVMVYMVETPEFQEWLEEMTGIPGLLDEGRVTVEDMCALASMGTFKCYLGGWMNPICVSAVGVSIACAGYKIWDWLTS